MILPILSWLLGTLLLIAILWVASLVVATLWIAAKAERLVPPVGKFIEIDGNRIHYVDQGGGARSSLCTGLALNSIISGTLCSGGSARATG
ncbi:hypothetical protein [Mesorhizobium sp. M0047]|uniref:hypothetical protein n=1 Tax=Mesorhizobium sp. M0047 TaxID=2956859 RepID=UPI00333AD9E0